VKALGCELRSRNRLYAGSGDKVAFLRDELGFDAVFNYHDGPIRELLKEAAGDGIDVYFDNVGGEHLEAAIDAMRPFGRIAMCGFISQYNATERPLTPSNMDLCIRKRLTLRGFIIRDHIDRYPEFLCEVEGWLRAGKLRYARRSSKESSEHPRRSYACSAARTPASCSSRSPNHCCAPGANTNHCSSSGERRPFLHITRGVHKLGRDRIARFAAGPYLCGDFFAVPDVVASDAPGM